jgi:DNA-directed RNA polymerase specialized sigma24 family protein
LTKSWAPTEDGFRHFLNWLDEGVESDGRKYVELRRRLVLYFDRKNCLCPDDLADETLSRVAQKLEEKGAITDLSPAHYCYIVAKFVFLEDLRRAEHRQSSVEELVKTGKPPGNVQSAGVEEFGSAEREKLFQCLEHCLEKLPHGDRELILEYHRGEGRTKIETRRRLAERLGVSPNALSIRACRIRDKVEVCVTACMRER